MISGFRLVQSARTFCTPSSSHLLCTASPSRTVSLFTLQVQHHSAVKSMKTMRPPATSSIEDYVLPAARNSARLLPYHRLDVSLRRSFSPWGSEAEWYLQISNLYSRRNEWFVQYGTENPDTKPEIIKMLPIIPTLGLNFKF